MKSKSVSQDWNPSSTVYVSQNQCLHSGLKKAEIEDDGIQAILTAVGHENSNIRKIYLWGNNVSSNYNFMVLIWYLVCERGICTFDRAYEREKNIRS